MPIRSRQVGTSRALASEGTSTRETNHHGVPPTAFEPAPQVAAEQQRLLEMEEMIPMMVRRNQEMQRQFRVKMEQLKHQNPNSSQDHGHVPALANLKL